jgi:hypothetical protein
MDRFWALAEQGGVSQAECAQLKNLGWDNYGITAKAGDALRKLLIQRIGMAPSDITDEFFSLVVTSYATGARKDLGEGSDGPGSVWNFLVCLAIDLGGKGMPMTGMHFKEGKFFEGYMKCVNETTAKSLGKQVATHMVVLLSNAFFQSPMCMVEVHHAIHSGIKLVLVAIEELEWPVEEKAWPLDTSRTRFPFSDGTVKWGGAEFASNRAAVLAEVTGGNSYPRPGSVTMTWAQHGGFDVLSWIVGAVGGSLEDSEELIGTQPIDLASLDRRLEEGQAAAEESATPTLQAAAEHGYGHGEPISIWTVSDTSAKSADAVQKEDCGEDDSEDEDGDAVEEGSNEEERRRVNETERRLAQQQEVP